MGMGRSREETLEAELESARRQIQELESRLAREEKLQRALQDHRKFREAVIERATEGVCVCHDVPADPFLQFTVWNGKMVEITGYQMEEINRLGWYQALYPDPEVRERARERMERMRQGEDLRGERWEIRRADGEKRAIAISTSVLAAEDGSVQVLGLMRDLKEEEELKRQRQLARTDELTSVRNRRGFEEEAGLLFRLARRLKLSITLGYLDLTGFKTLNDERGHLEGDRVLQAIGKTFLESVRSTDVVARIGGDEFAVVLAGTGASGARTFFEALQARLLHAIGTGGWEIGFGVGVVTFAGQVPDLSEALRKADAAMYRAKKAGERSAVYELHGSYGADESVVPNPELRSPGIATQGG